MFFTCLSARLVTPLKFHGFSLNLRRLKFLYLGGQRAHFVSALSLNYDNALGILINVVQNKVNPLVVRVYILTQWFSKRLYLFKKLILMKLGFEGVLGSREAIQ